MKLVFLVGGLEPGSDGVGDYTRLLADSCRAQNHEVMLIALADSFIASDANPKLKGNELRLSAGSSWEKRIAITQSHIRDFAPDWISVQMVSYSFHPKGFLSSRIEGFKRALSGIPTHVMFHELWIGFWAKSTIRERYVGWRQKRELVRFVSSLAPKVTHTSIPLYRKMLELSGVPSTLLPLFGNIPIIRGDAWIKHELENLGITTKKRDEWLLIGIMGSVHARWPDSDWLEYLATKANALGRQVAFLGIGRISDKGRESLVNSVRNCSKRILFHHFGSQSADRISEYLQTLDAGVSTVEKSVLGKSGSVAAMREHGLPVIVPRVDDAVDTEAASQELHHSLQCLLEGTLEPLPPVTIEDVSIQFVQSLRSCVKK